VTDELRSFFRGFTISLRARNKSPRTVESYLLAADQLVTFLEEHGHPTTLGDIRRRHVEEFIAVTLETRAPATAAHRYASLQQFFRWAVDEGEIDVSPMQGMTKPKIPDRPIPLLSDDQLRAMLDTVKGAGFEERRDAALLRLFIDTGARLSEIAELKLGDVDLDRQQLVTVVKGRHVQVKYFGARTAQALDRYERTRRKHRYADLDWLWLSLKGRLSASGIRQTLKRRAAEAGIEHLHPHMFRHTFAHRWLSEGGNEGDLQRLMGWRDRQMLDRYGASGATARAKDAHGRMRLGDRL
jgi:site-specific recombinase XerD